MIRRLFRQRKWRITLGILLFFFIASASLMFIPTSYYVMRPGSAMALQPMVTVEGGQKNAKGTFMLTTVEMGPASALGYLYAKIDPYADLISVNQIRGPHETDAQYTQRELEIMKDSQQTAEIIAFEKAGLQVKVKNLGAIVMQIIPGMPAADVLKVGDVIHQVNGKEVTTAQELLIALSGKKVGEKVELQWTRNQTSMKKSITLAKLPTTSQDVRAGIGIASPLTKRDVQLPNRVTIQSENIGGPSAGLMFTLEIMDQVSKQDWTKGYRIAGTGEMLQDGTVGRIGGIEHKVQAAAKENADIFFAPNDQLPMGVKDRTNYQEALDAAKSLNTTMKIVPVQTVDDAIRYLQNLPPKA